MRTSGSALPFPSWTVLLVTLLFLPAQPIAAQEFRAAIAVRDVTPAPLLPVSGGLGPSSPTTQQQGNLNVRANSLSLLLAASLLNSAPTVAGEPPAQGAPRSAHLGLFTHHADVGPVRQAGSLAYDPDRQEYRITGSGANMWFAQDEFHFAWRQIRGDFIVRAHARFLGDGVDPHRKLGWIARSSLVTDSPHVNASVHGDGLASLQFRRTPGAQTEEVQSPVQAPDVIQLERAGNRFTLSVARFGDPLVTTQVEDLVLGDELYVGLYVCSHHPDVTEQVLFHNVRVILPAPRGFVPYRDYLGSHLEILDVHSGHRTILHHTPDSMQAPNWTPDDRALIYNRNGRLYRFDLEQRHARPIDTRFADRNNNDHVLSFDGQQLGISHHSPTDGGHSIIYRLPVTGGVPQRVTPLGPSYLHGWSPDGQFLVYTGQRNGQYDIYRIPTTGGEEIQLTNTPALDDGSEYSPDGAWIYFNSSRTGRMQLWRMRPNGTQPEQVTDDAFNNWFPHVSPDGRWIVFLSYSPEVDPNDHPFYQQVYLRRIPTAGGPPSVIAYLYGGQGSINVPSWSPDSTRVAFVSNSGNLPDTP
jgi:TolB protein